MLIPRRKLITGAASLAACSALPRSAPAQFLGVLQQQVRNRGGAGPVTVQVISYSVVDDTTASPSGSVTVPSDATSAVLFVISYNTTTDVTLSAATLGTGGGQVSFTEQTSSYDLGGVSDTSIDVWFAADISGLAGGSETLAATRGGTATEGGSLFVVWIKGAAAASPVTDAGTDDWGTGPGAGGSTADAVVTINSNTTDLGVGIAEVYIASNPTVPTGWTQLGSQHDANSHSVIIVHRAGASPTITLSETVDDYASAAAISIAD